MKCPFCEHGDSRVLDSRSGEGNQVIRRRRECPSCGRRFTTYERAAELQLFVVKKDGRREPFDRRKVIAGMTKACEKRSIARDAIEQAADRIARQAREELSDEVPTSQIGAWVMDALRAIDGVAYVRFASVYKEFRDTDSFVKEVESLDRKPVASATKGPRGRTPESESSTLQLFDSPKLKEQS
ncbi:MAG: transcriptional regulator NrdR [Armatimonadota bacterium]